MLQVISARRANCSPCFRPCWRTPLAFARPSSASSGSPTATASARSPCTAFRPHLVLRAHAIDFSIDPEAPLGRLAGTKRLVHVADITEDRATERDSGRSSNLPTSWSAHLLLVPMLKENAHRRDRNLPPRGTAVQRQTDRAADEFRQPGRHRDREHPAAQRAAQFRCSSRPPPPTCSR